jgi:hypothetical protein
MVTQVVDWLSRRVIMVLFILMVVAFDGGWPVVLIQWLNDLSVWVDD